MSIKMIKSRFVDTMLPEGMYFLKMNGGKTVKVFKE